MKFRLTESYADLSLRQISDVVEGSVGNMPDNQLDSDLRLYKYIGKQLGISNYDDVWVLSEWGEEYHPKNYYTEAPVQKSKTTLSHNLIKYSFNDIDIIVENHKSGNTYYYFDSEGSAMKYVNMVDSINNGELQ